MQDRLVSFDNPTGDISNSDLELTGSITHHDIFAQFADVAERTIHNCYDNIAAVYWQRKGATTTLEPAAFLLRLQRLHQRFYRYVPLKDYLPGSLNTMADFLSRRWGLTDAEILSHFNSNFPQKRPWRLCRVRTEIHSALTLALSRRWCEPELILHTPEKRISIETFGWNTAQLSKSIHTVKN